MPATPSSQHQPHARGKTPRSRFQRRIHSYRDSIALYSAAGLLLLGSLWFTYQFVEPAPPGSLTLATGNPEGAYHAFGLQLQQEFARQDVTLNLLPTQGTISNLQALNKGTADIAFVQSGIADDNDFPDLEGLASVYYEPLWIFSNQADRLQTIGELRGLRVAIGETGSGTQQVARDLLEVNGLNDRDLILLNQGGMQSAQQLLDKEIDAVMIVAAPSAPMVDTLLTANGIKLLNLRRSEAYARRYPHFSHLSIPEGTIDFERNIPSENVQLIAASATLVAGKDLHPALADLMMQASATIFRRDTLFSNAEQFPSAANLDFPLSDEADRFFTYGVPFLQRYLPFWAATLIDRLKLLALPMLALLIPLSRILPPAYRWSVRKKVYRWYGQVQDIDQAVREEQSGDDVASEYIALLDAIDDEAREIDVPLSYAHELYALRMHIDLLRRQISKLQT